MKPSEKDKRVFDYMQEQANNLLDYCIKNEIDLENIGFFVDSETGYAYLSAGVSRDNGRYILSRSKQNNEHGGEWNTGIAVLQVGGERNDE